MATGVAHGATGSQLAGWQVLCVGAHPWRVGFGAVVDRFRKAGLDNDLHMGHKECWIAQGKLKSGYHY